MAQFVRLGDTSDHGGEMVSASATIIINGLPVCIDKDIHSCPILGHGDTEVTGTAGPENNGIPYIRTGDKAGCGAVITAGSPDTFTV